METFIQQKGDHTGNQPSGFLKIQEIANYLGIKVSTIYALVERRGIPHYRVGRLVRFKKPEVDQWMEGQRKPAVDVKVEAQKVGRSLHKKSDLAIDRIVKKAVDGAKGKGYNSGYGKPDQIRGLGKEVSDGSL
jgi:excisionase family DNA binding protein